MRLTLQTQVMNDVVVIRCKGRIILGQEAGDLQAELDTQTEIWQKVVLNLAETDYLDSFGLGTLVRTHSALRARGGELKLCEPHASVVRVLQMTKLLAVFASISAFGALNGWILLQGELPSAMAKRGEFPRIFARESSRRSPSFGLCFGSALVTLLILANYQKSMVNIFTFMILLSTTACLVLYAVCSLALLRLQWKGQLQGARKGSVALAIVGILATAYSLWAIVGAGAEAVIWGAVLLLLGVPLYFWFIRSSR